MLDIDEIIKKLGDRNLAEVARRVGLTPQYLTLIVSKKRHAGELAIRKLSDYLEQHP